MTSLATASDPNVQFVTALALLIAAIAIVVTLTPATVSVATLTVPNSTGTRSADPASIPTVRLKEDVLKLVLTLPQPVTPSAGYRVEIMDDKDMHKTLDARQENQSAVVEIKAGELHRGQYAATVSALDDQGRANRIPGTYYFTIE